MPEELYLDAYQGFAPKEIVLELDTLLQSLVEQESRPEVAGELTVLRKKLEIWYK